MRPPSPDEFKTGAVAHADSLQGPARPPAAFGAAAAATISSDRRASLPRPPALPAAVLESQAERLIYRQSREALERRSMLRGLILLAMLALIIGIAHAGWGRAFPSGWWRQW